MSHFFTMLLKGAGCVYLLESVIQVKRLLHIYIAEIAFHTVDQPVYIPIFSYQWNCSVESCNSCCFSLFKKATPYLISCYYLKPFKIILCSFKVLIQSIFLLFQEVNRQNFRGLSMNNIRLKSSRTNELTMTTLLANINITFG